jgi:hypothetical protein
MTREDVTGKKHTLLLITWVFTFCVKCDLQKSFPVNYDKQKVFFVNRDSVSSKIDGKINYWQKINIFGKENHIRNKAQKNVNDRYQKECKTISTEKD